MPGEILVGEGPVALFGGRGAILTLDGREHRRPARAGRIALPLRRGQPGARVRPRGRARATASRSPPAPRCASSRASTARSTLVAARRPPRRRRAARRGRRAAGRSEVTDRRPRPLRARSTARRPATASAWPTPTCSSRSTEDLAGSPAGDEAVFGGGKVIRESMGQATATRAEGTPDLVITGAVVLDHWGVVKADVGVRDGRIVALGKAGNPDIMDGVHPALVIGPSTEVLAGNGKILTAGAVDCHVHLIARRSSRRRCRPASPRSSAAAPARPRAPRPRRSRPAPGTSARMLRGAGRLARQRGAAGQGQHGVARRRCASSCVAGASGFKLHEDWGTTPAAIDACLRVCDAEGVQAAIHTDTLNEAGLRRVHAGRDRRAVDPHVPHRGRGRRPRPRHHHGRVAGQRAAVVDQPDAAAHRQHAGRAPRHAHGLPPPQPHDARGPGVRREPHPARRRSRPRTCCTTSARSR